MKDWVSPIYSFFDPTPMIVEEGRRRVQVFKCSRQGCQRGVQRYLDTKDASSSSNLWKHVCTCWGDKVLIVAGKVKDASEAWTKIIAPFLRTGSITESFERKGKQATYSHRQHTQAETRCKCKLPVFDA